MVQKTKDIDLDKELLEAEAVEELPKSCDVPEGWPPFRNYDGDCWYQRALAWEHQTGHKALPLKYLYDEEWNIIEAPEHEPEVVEEKEVENGTTD